MDLALLAIIGVLLTFTVGAAIEYYRLIRRTRSEYDKAKELVEDVVLSFSRELRRESGRLDAIAYESMANASRMDTAAKKLDNVERTLAPIGAQMATVSEESEKINAVFAETRAKMREIEESQETLKAKIAGAEEQVQKFLATPPELKIEPVMPIKRDKAMASLTETEIAVLEILAAEGAKTAPEVKERVQLSREHTARLMKKLYEGGYLERETGKTPFKYSIKKEMESFLKKQESVPSA